MMAMGNFRAAESSDKVDDVQSTSTAKLALEAGDASSQVTNPQSRRDNVDITDTMISMQSAVSVKDKIIDANQQIIKFVLQTFDALSVKADFEQKKSQVLLGILEAMKTFKNFEFSASNGNDAEQTKKIVKGQIKQRILNDEQIFHRLKKLILLRERDRSTRENSIKILKKLIKFTKKSCKILLDMKMEVFISFILEREYKHAQVIKERMQCFKLIQAWIEKDPKTFPYLLG